MERVSVTEFTNRRRKRVSWGSIFAGVMTVLAISVLLSILGSSIGLYMFDPTSDSPASGIGTTIGIWTVVSLLISLAAGGFVAGKLAGADGIIHGFLVWATTFIVAVILGIWLAVGAVKVTANVLGSVTSVAGNVLSGVGSAVGSGVSNLSDQVGDLFDEIDIDTDGDRASVRHDIRQALRKSGVRELQPEYLQSQMKAVRKDMQRSVQRLVKNPNDADNIISGFTDRLKERTDRITQNIDRNDLTQAIANNSSMSQAEVERAVDEYTEIINNGREQAREQIDNLQQSIEQARVDLEEFKQQALEEADKASNKAATSGIISFFAMLIGGGLCAFAGMFGGKKTMQGYEV